MLLRFSRRRTYKALLDALHNEDKVAARRLTTANFWATLPSTGDRQLTFDEFWVEVLDIHQAMARMEGRVIHDRMLVAGQTLMMTYRAEVVVPDAPGGKKIARTTDHAFFRSGLVAWLIITGEDIRSVQPANL